MLVYSGFCHSYGTKHWSPCRIFSQLQPKALWTSNSAHWWRTWYPMYVLDRLLALQLGRPVVIHEADFHVELPSVEDSFPFDHATNKASSMSNACSRVSNAFHSFLSWSFRSYFALPKLIYVLTKCLTLRQYLTAPDWVEDDPSTSLAVRFGTYLWQLLLTTNPQDSSQTAADTLGSTSFASSPHVSGGWPSEISSAMEWSLQFLDFSNTPPVDLPFTGDGQTEQ